MRYDLTEEEKKLMNSVSIGVLSLIHDLTRIRFICEDGQIVAIEV